MGKIEELEKGMALLEKMRSVIGKELYAAKVKSLYAAMPDFDAAVEIIDVDADEQTSSSIHWGTTKRELATDEEVDSVTSTSNHDHHCKDNKKGRVSHDVEEEQDLLVDDNQDCNEGREIVWYDELGRFRPDGYVMGQDAADDDAA